MRNCDGETAKHVLFTVCEREKAYRRKTLKEGLAGGGLERKIIVKMLMEMRREKRKKKEK